jgi:hypothetical protein
MPRAKRCPLVMGGDAGTGGAADASNAERLSKARVSAKRLTVVVVASAETANTGNRSPLMTEPNRIMVV